MQRLVRAANRPRGGLRTQFCRYLVELLHDGIRRVGIDSIVGNQLVHARAEALCYCRRAIDGGFAHEKIATAPRQEGAARETSDQFKSELWCAETGERERVVFYILASSRPAIFSLSSAVMALPLDKIANSVKPHARHLVLLTDTPASGWDKTLTRLVPASPAASVPPRTGLHEPGASESRLFASLTALTARPSPSSVQQAASENAAVSHLPAFSSLPPASASPNLIGAKISLASTSSLPPDCDHRAGDLLVFPDRLVLRGVYSTASSSAPNANSAAAAVADFLCARPAPLAWQLVQPHRGAPNIFSSTVFRDTLEPVPALPRSGSDRSSTMPRAASAAATAAQLSSAPLQRRLPFSVRAIAAPTTHLLVCCHTQRDARCGLHGHAIVDALRACIAEECYRLPLLASHAPLSSCADARPPSSAFDVDAFMRSGHRHADASPRRPPLSPAQVWRAMHVWPVSHVGGHELAGNVIFLPTGDWFGLVRDAAQAAAALRAYVRAVLAASRADAAAGGGGVEGDSANVSAAFGQMLEAELPAELRARWRNQPAAACSVCETR